MNKNQQDMGYYRQISLNSIRANPDFENYQTQFERGFTYKS
jgi:hypothetical protein